MRVHDSQAYGEMDVTRELISRILELTAILLSFQTGFSLVNAAVACAILERISGLNGEVKRSRIIKCLYFDNSPVERSNHGFNRFSPQGRGNKSL